MTVVTQQIRGPLAGTGASILQDMWQGLLKVPRGQRSVSLFHPWDNMGEPSLLTPYSKNHISLASHTSPFTATWLTLSPQRLSVLKLPSTMNAHPTTQLIWATFLPLPHHLYKNNKLQTITLSVLNGTWLRKSIFADVMKDLEDEYILDHLLGPYPINLVLLSDRWDNPEEVTWRQGPNWEWCSHKPRNSKGCGSWKRQEGTLL
jgi:hypothetical protein